MEVYSERYLNKIFFIQQRMLKNSTKSYINLRCKLAKGKFHYV